VEVRAATIDDVAAIAPIYRASSTAREPDEIDDALVLGMLRDAIDRGIALVAIDDGVIGFVLGPRHPVRRCAHVMTNVLICVEASRRRRGVGRALMTALIESARATDWCERIEFYVRSSNTNAIALYESLGFVIEGRLRSRIEGPSGRVDDLIMARLLPRQDPQSSTG
jgi:putative acetyltransferase